MPAGAAANGTRLQIWSCGNDANQQWTLPGGTTTPPPTTRPRTTRPLATGVPLDDPAKKDAAGLADRGGRSGVPGRAGGGTGPGVLQPVGAGRRERRVRALGQFACYDAAVVHGYSGMRSIRSAALRVATPPAQGGSTST